MSAKRTPPTVSLRLPGFTDPVSLSLLDGEREALERAAGAESLSAWARRVVEAASEASGAGGAEEAAAAARLPLRAWVRVILLEAAWLTDIRSQLARARRVGTRHA